MARTEWAAEVMVRLDEDDAAMLDALCREYGTNRADAARQAIRGSVTPPDMWMRARYPAGHPCVVIAPDWLVWGPISPVNLKWRAEALLRQGYQVQAVQSVGQPTTWPDPPDPAPPPKQERWRPSHIDDDPEPCDECGAEPGDEHDETCTHWRPE